MLRFVLAFELVVVFIHFEAQNRINYLLLLQFLAVESEVLGQPFWKST